MSCLLKKILPFSISTKTESQTDSSVEENIQKLEKSGGPSASKHDSTKSNSNSNSTSRNHSSLSRHPSVSRELTLSDNPTPLIPERFARIVSSLSKGSTVTLRLGTYVVSSLLDTARIGTLTSLNITSSALESLLLKAEHDTRTNSSASITESSMNIINRAATLAQLCTAASFHFATSSLQRASIIAQDTLHILDAIFGSTESSRALAAIISLMRREFGDGTGMYSLVSGLTCFTILQARGWSRTVDEIEMFIVWDVVVLDTGETLSQQFPSTDSHQKETEEEAIISTIPNNSQYKIALNEVTTKTYAVEVTTDTPIPKVVLPEDAIILHREITNPSPQNGGKYKYTITFQTTSNYYRERKGTLSKENPQVSASEFIPDPMSVSITNRDTSPELPDNYDDEPPSCIHDRRYSFNNPLVLETLLSNNENSDSEYDSDLTDDDSVYLHSPSCDRPQNKAEHNKSDYTINSGSRFNRQRLPHSYSDSFLSTNTDRTYKHTERLSECDDMRRPPYSSPLKKTMFTPGNINRRSLTKLSALAQSSLIEVPEDCESCKDSDTCSLSSRSSSSNFAKHSSDLIKSVSVVESSVVPTTPKHKHSISKFPPGHITQNMAKYMRFATASYGQSFMHVLGIGKFKTNYTSVDDATHHSEHYAFASHTHLDLQDILLSSYSDSVVDDKAGIPLVHFVALDHAAKTVVLTIRGTLGIEDILTDLTCDYESMNWGEKSWKAHGGMLRCAQILKRKTSRVLNTIKQALETWGDEYGLVICGHSLGGGVGAILGILLTEMNSSGTFVTSGESGLPVGRRVHCFAFGPPASISEELREKTRALITTVVYGLDIVPCLSLGVLRDFQAVALAFKNDREGVAADIRKRFLAQFSSRHIPLAVHDSDDDYLWNLLTKLRKVMNSEKLVPPGEVYHISTNTVFETHDGKTKRATRIIGKVIVDVQKRFGEPVFGRGIFHHSPVYYERALKTLEMGVCNAPV